MRTQKNHDDANVHGRTHRSHDADHDAVHSHDHNILQRLHHALAGSYHLAGSCASAHDGQHHLCHRDR